MARSSYLGRETTRTVEAVRHWTPARWRSAINGSVRSRADIFYEALQELADLVAEIENQPRRVVPRLDSDMGLVTQWQVIMGDLIANDPDSEAQQRAEAVIRQLRHELFGVAA